jgi:hypothetical protein
MGAALAGGGLSSKLKRWLGSVYRARSERHDKLRDMEWRLVEIEGRLASLEGLLKPKGDTLKK